MIRYYYTCPIQAAYMAEYFGIKLSYFACDADEWTVYKSTRSERPFCPDSFYSRNNEPDWDVKIYVKSEFDHIFEPKTNDIFSYKMFGKVATYILPENQDGKEWAKEASEIKIIMRDNKQFFMAEIEND